MDDTGFVVPDDKIDRFAANYGARPRQVAACSSTTRSAVGYRKPPTFLSGGGGLVSTTADYLRFAQMLRNGGELDGVRVLGRKTVELMTQNHLPGGGELREFALPGGYGEVGFDGTGFGLTVAVGLGPVAHRSDRLGRRVHVGRRGVDDLLGGPGRGARRRVHDPAHAVGHVQLPRPAQDAGVPGDRRLTGGAARAAPDISSCTEPRSSNHPAPASAIACRRRDVDQHEPRSPVQDVAQRAARDPADAEREQRGTDGGSPGRVATPR